MGAGAWAFIFVIGAMAACLVVAWPVALANHNGHIAAWGWIAEAAWLLVIALGVAAGNARQRKAAQA